MNLELQGPKTLFLEDALVVDVWEASYLNVRKNLFRGGEGGSLVQITQDALPNHTQQPTTACQRARG